MVHGKDPFNIFVGGAEDIIKELEISMRNHHKAGSQFGYLQGTLEDFMAETGVNKGKGDVKTPPSARKSKGSPMDVFKKNNDVFGR